MVKIALSKPIVQQMNKRRPLTKLSMSSIFTKLRYICVLCICKPRVHLFPWIQFIQYVGQEILAMWGLMQMLLLWSMGQFVMRILGNVGVKFKIIKYEGPAEFA